MRVDWGLATFSNKSDGKWELRAKRGVCSDQVAASAILDRVLQHSTTFNILGRSYWLREKHQSGIFHDLTATTREG